MKWTVKLLGGAGALVVTLASAGAVVYASTSNSATTTSTIAKTERKADFAQAKNLREETKTDAQTLHGVNEQLKSDWASLKGKHLKKTDPTDYQAILDTHNSILGARAKLDTDEAAILKDRQTKNWSQMVADLQTREADVQALVGLKQQQLSNVEKAVSAVNTSVTPQTNS